MNDQDGLAQSPLLYTAEEGWQRGPRVTVGEAKPPALQAKPGWKTFEAELHAQIRYCDHKLQQDLDLLHEQVHNEIYSAVAQELAGVALKIGTIQSQVQAEIETLRTTVGQLCNEAQWMRQVREEDASEAKQAAKSAAAEVSKALADEATHLNQVISEIRSEFTQRLLKL